MSFLTSMPPVAIHKYQAAFELKLHQVSHDNVRSR